MGPNNEFVIRGERFVPTTRQEKGENIRPSVVQNLKKRGSARFALSKLSMFITICTIILFSISTILFSGMELADWEFSPWVVYSVIISSGVALLQQGISIIFQKRMKNVELDQGTLFGIECTNIEVLTAFSQEPKVFMNFTEKWLSFCGESLKGGDNETKRRFKLGEVVEVFNRSDDFSIEVRGQRSYITESGNFIGTIGPHSSYILQCASWNPEAVLV